MKPILDFVVQIIVGTVGFLVVFGAAIFLSIVVRASEGLTPHWVQIMAEYAEKLLFGTDLFCFGLFVLSETLKLARSLWSEWRH